MLRCTRLAATGTAAIALGVGGLGLAGLAALATPAAASATTDAVTMSPSNPATGPFDHETVPISGTYTGSGNVDILECLAAAVPRAGMPLDHTQCDRDNVRAGLTPDPSTGAFGSYFVFDLHFTTSGPSPTPVDCSLAGACELVADANPPGDLIAGQLLEGVLSCKGVFDDAAIASFAKGTTPAGGTFTQATGTLPVVAPGQTVQVHLSWNQGSFVADLGLSASNDCISVNGADRTDLAVVLAVGDTGSDATSVTVPADAQTGDKVCDRGQISGVTLQGLLDTGLTEYSNIVCFQVGPSAVTPETPWTILLAAAAGLGLAGGFLVLRRRRRA